MINCDASLATLPPKASSSWIHRSTCRKCCFRLSRRWDTGPCATARRWVSGWCRRAAQCDAAHLGTGVTRGRHRIRWTAGQGRLCDFRVAGKAL